MAEVRHLTLVRVTPDERVAEVLREASGANLLSVVVVGFDGEDLWYASSVPLPEMLYFLRKMEHRLLNEEGD